MKKKLSLLLVLMLVVSLPITLFAQASETYALTLNLPEGRTEEDLWLIYDEEVYPDLSALASGETFVFEIGLHEKYDSVYTTIYENGSVLNAMPDGKYAVYMDRDIEITCPLNDGTNFRLKMFNVSNPTGDGYRVRPEAALGFQNYKVEWDGTYVFRVILLDEYKGAYVEDDYENSRINVSVSYFITNEEGEQEEVVLQVGDEGFEFVGTDTDGSPLFRLTNIKNDMFVNVGMLTSDSFFSVITWMKNILRLILNLFTGGGEGGFDFDGIFDNLGNIFNGGGLGGLADL